MLPQWLKEVFRHGRRLSASHFRRRDWLEKAFGFERSMVITDSSGKLGHAEMKFADGYIMVGSEWADFVASPASVAGKNTQTIHVQLNDGLDAHCERARAAGAVIMREPEDQFYGDRVYTAKDPEGHVWSFAQNLLTSRARKPKRRAD